jgi:hypothetical protein
VPHSVRADLILDVAAFEVGARICSTESESLAHLSRIRQQRNDTMALPITMANTAEDSPLATLAGITSPTAAAALGSAQRTCPRSP